LSSGPTCIGPMSPCTSKEDDLPRRPRTMLLWAVKRELVSGSFVASSRVKELLIQRRLAPSDDLDDVAHAVLSVFGAPHFEGSCRIHNPNGAVVELRANDVFAAIGHDFASPTP
jgi:hypothetical protein